MKYTATATKSDLITLDTNSFRSVMNFLTAHEDEYCEVVDNSTGEILCYFNRPGSPDYMSEEFEWMTIGFAVKMQAEAEATHEQIMEELIAEYFDMKE